MVGAHNRRREPDTMHALLLTLVCLAIDLSPLPPITPAERVTTDRLRSNDIIILSPSSRTTRTVAAIGDDPWYVAAVDGPEHLRELERWLGNDRSAFDNTMPSGAKVYPVREETAAVLFTIEKADGIVSDSDYLSIEPLEGPQKGRLLWVKNNVVLLPLPRPDPKRPISKIPATNTLWRADRLRTIGRHELANSAYRTILERWPQSPEAKVAARRLRGIKASSVDQDPSRAKSAGPASRWPSATALFVPWPDRQH